MSQQQHYDQVMMEQHQQEVMNTLKLVTGEKQMNYNELRKINVSDHIAESKNNLDQVFDFLMNETK